MRKWRAWRKKPGALHASTRVGTAAAARYRLVGVGLGNFTEADDPRVQPDLFTATAS